MGNDRRRKKVVIVTSTFVLVGRMASLPLCISLHHREHGAVWNHRSSSSGSSSSWMKRLTTWSTGCHLDAATSTMTRRRTSDISNYGNIMHLCVSQLSGDIPLTERTPFFIRITQLRYPMIGIVEQVPYFEFAYQLSKTVSPVLFIAVGTSEGNDSVTYNSNTIRWIEWIWWMERIS